MPKFTVYAAAAVTLWAEVEAATKEEALELAEELSTPSHCHQAYFDNACQVDWVTAHAEAFLAPRYAPDYLARKAATTPAETVAA